ncbi:MAG: hypothetical protein KJ882_00155, partial [Proteobacteria bacterium]|nr:hypothetical protein [Pseudomonadota bacterium]
MNIFVIIKFICAVVIALVSIWALSMQSIRAYIYNKALLVGGFIKSHCGCVLVVQCAVYAFAYDALMPGSMYFSPDSVLYLSVSSIVPATFSLLARALIELEVALGSTRIVLLRYVVIAIYCAGGWLIAKALLRSGRPLLALLVLPTIWSMSSLTQWFNFFLTDGISTAFLMACIGAYANMYVSIKRQSRGAWGWLAIFVFFGMMAFSMRPAFAFIAPVMVIMMMNRAIFSWRRIAVVTIGIALLATAHFSFTIFWHGRVPSQLGGVLTALVFDLPIPNVCPSDDDTDLCNTQRALEPFIRASNGLGATREQFVYKVLNNGEIVRTARAAVRGNDPNYSVLLEIALLKIKTSPMAYVSMVLRNSYYSVKSWGDWAWNDSLLNVAKVNIATTNAIASAVSAAMRTVAKIDFDPTIKGPPTERFYTDILFQFPRLVVSHGVISNWTFTILVVALIFSVVPFFFAPSLPGSILFSCCVFSLAGIVFQNFFFPAIPRL